MAGISTDAGNQAILGSDSQIFVPHDSSKYDAANPTGYITAAAVPTGSSTPPAMAGTASAGTQSQWSRGDHVHPVDVSRAPVVGVTDGSSAAAGNVGEVISGSQATATSLATGTPIGLVTLALTPGDWTVSGVIVFNPSAAPTSLTAAINTAASLPSAGNIVAGTGTSTQLRVGFNSGTTQTFHTGLARMNLAAAASVYLVAQGTFPSGTLTVTGYASARRVR